MLGEMLALRRYLGALSVAIAAYAAYALLAAPWLEPRAMGRGAASTLPPQPVAVDEGYRRFFAPDMWERDNPKIVETAQCTLLLKDYQPLSDGRMEINPCTLIFYTAPAAPGAPGGPVERRPIVMRALQGAVLQFDRPIDLGRATMGRLMEGTLRGSIRIFSPESSPGAGDALELLTRNVKIDREKIYTSSTVDFRYGKSFGSGRDLTITFMPEDKERDKGSPGLQGLSVLQLARVERLHLEGEAAGMLPQTDPPAPDRGDGAAEGGDPPLEVHCDGPLVIDFEQNLAALDENVEISRVYPQGPSDRLTCDRLIFRLSERRGNSAAKNASKKASAPAQGNADGNRWSARQLTEQVERVTAIGTPVILDAPQAGIYARAERAEYDATTRRIALEAGPTAPLVTLRRLESQFEAREIEYELAEAGRLGRLWAAGPGRLKFVPQPGQGSQTVEAAWQQELTIAPHEKNKIIALKGRPSVHLGGESSFSASEIQQAGRIVPGEIYLWVLEVPREEASAEGASRQSPKFVIQPDRMLATGQVEIDSPQLAAHTQELQAWFLNQSAPQVPAAPRAGAIFEPPPQPAAREPGPQPPKLQKLDMTGKLVQLQVLRRGNQSQVENLAISGGVTVKELATAGPAAEGPLSLVGDLVTLRQGTSPAAKLEIHGWAGKAGQPPRHAKVSARGLSLSGQTIHLLPADNRLWISGPGEAVLPIPQDQGQERSLVPPPDLRRDTVRPNAAGGDQAASRPTRPLAVTWHDAFEFDGQRGVFSGHVKALGDAEFAEGQELTFTLNQRIDFQAPRQSGSIALARLHFAGGMGEVVMQRAVRDEQGQTTAVDNARVRSLDIDQTTGKFSAAGPGEVWTVRRDMKAIPGGGLVPARPDAAGKLAYVCVKFQGQIVGDMNRREVEFQRQVETTYGQVQKWNQRVEAARIEDLGESGVFVQSDTLKLTEMVLSPTQRWIEIDANGNAQAEGLKFVARAARIGYTSDKDQLVIEGDGRVAAEFWSRSEPGGATSYLEAGRLIYQRTSGSLQVQDAKTGTFDTSNLPKGGKPAPKLR
jgi:hypothetical protein